MKTLYCPECHTKVAEISKGSKIKKGATMICSTCETRRKALELRFRGQQNNSAGSMFDEVFGRR